MSKASQRPTETTTVLVGAMSSVVITILGIQDAAVLSALPAAIGAIPMATTFWQARRKATERAGA
ncbi:MAG: hypothetical protein M3N52_11560, partial [Actinomycetota bacterium]|nr:hypothetical protein [Actinomycetota bacterium]